MPVTDIRAGLILGAGSASFEMIRNLTERLPIMICPTWVYTHVQPIGIRNVLDYLTAAWLQFEARSHGSHTLLVQAAFFEPHGLLGLLYWYLPYPIHGLIFRTMIGAISRRAVGLALVDTPRVSP